jgi:hypothetical protein
MQHRRSRSKNAPPLARAAAPAATQHATSLRRRRRLAGGDRGGRQARADETVPAPDALRPEAPLSAAGWVVRGWASVGNASWLHAATQPRAETAPAPLPRGWVRAGGSAQGKQSSPAGRPPPLTPPADYAPPLPPADVLPWAAAAHCAFGLWMHTYFRAAAAGGVSRLVSADSANAAVAYFARTARGPAARSRPRAGARRQAARERAKPRGGPVREGRAAQQAGQPLENRAASCSKAYNLCRGSPLPPRTRARRAAACGRA